MTFNPIYLLYGAFFLAALLLVEGTYYFLIDTGIIGRKNVNRRISMLKRSTDSQAVLQTLLRKPLKKEGVGNLAVAFLDNYLAQAGLTISASGLILRMLGAWIILFFCAQFLAKPYPFLSAALVTLITTVIIFTVPVLYITYRIRRRMRQFEKQLPDALDLVVRSLEAGHPINAALAMVANEMPDPIGTEFGIVVDEIRYGMTLEQALDDMIARIDHQDLRYVAVTIKIQRGTGGNLAEVLSNVSTVIRNRFRMFSKVAALSAEGRLSAYVLTALPFVVAGVFSLLNPGYYFEVSNDPLLPSFLWAGVVLMGLGIVIIWRMVKIKV